jgi:hypothetical protein
VKAPVVAIGEQFYRLSEGVVAFFFIFLVSLMLLQNGMGESTVG